MTIHARKFVVAVTCFGLFAVGSADAGESSVVASGLRSTPVAAFGDLLVYSRYDKVARRYRLVLRSGGMERRLPLAGRRVPFDADIGPGPSSKARIVYSRCSREGPISPRTDLPLYGLGRLCRIYYFDVGGRREGRLRRTDRDGWSAYSPTVWRSIVSFAAARAEGRASLWTVRGVRGGIRRLSGGPSGMGDPGDLSGERGEQTLGPGPLHLDQRGRRLAFLWAYSPARCPSGSDRFLSAVWTEVRTVETGRSSRLVDRRCSYDGPDQLVAPSWTSGGDLLYGGITATDASSNEILASSILLRTRNGTGERSIDGRVVALAAADQTPVAAIMPTPRRINSAGTEVTLIRDP